MFHTEKNLRDYTTFGIGGPARYFIEVHHPEEMSAVLRFCEKQALPFFILGKGSNTLFDDRGYNGVVIANRIHFLNQNQDGQVQAGAGYSFSLLGSQTARQGWTGLEFAAGIPGTVGGAVFMNAGANGSETCDSLISVDFMTLTGEIVTFYSAELEFRYRYSAFREKKGAIISATFQLQRSPDARKKQLKIVNYRQSTQPYGLRSAGCIFKNPPQTSAGALIDKAGLKDAMIGGARVSSLHANFIVAESGATAEDVQSLIIMIKEKVKAEFDIELESEVCYVPFA